MLLLMPRGQGPFRTRCYQNKSNNEISPYLIELVDTEDPLFITFRPLNPTSEKIMLKQNPAVFPN